MEVLCNLYDFAETFRCEKDFLSEKSGDDSEWNINRI